MRNTRLSTHCEKSPIEKEKICCPTRKKIANKIGLRCQSATTLTINILQQKCGNLNYLSVL